MTDNKYPELPDPAYYAGPMPYVLTGHAYAVDQMRAYVDADRAMRAAEPDCTLKEIKPWEKLEEWERDGTLIERVIGALDSQEREIMRLEKLVAAEPAAPQGEPVAWYEYSEASDAWFLAYSKNPNAKTRPLVFGDTAAVAGLLGVVRTAQLQAQRLIDGDDEGSDLAQTKRDLPETLRVIEHAIAAPAAVAGPIPLEGWREQFKEAVYNSLAAADDQDVPLEEYPERILSVLDSVVGPRHPTVVHWRNDAIQACIAIAYKYCRDPESFQYLKQDLQALITAQAPQPGEPAVSQMDALRSDLIAALREVFDPDELETPQMVRDVIEYADSWLQVYIQKRAESSSTQPQEAAPSQDAEDAARLDWLLLHVSGSEFRRIGVHYSGNARRADVDAARAQQEGK